MASVEDAVLGITLKRKNGRVFFHAAFVYDVGLMIFGTPFGLYLAWKISSWLDNNFKISEVFLTSAIYVYAFVLGLWFYRISFGYARWAFPTMELKTSREKSARHRYLLFLLMSGVVVNAVYDVLKHSLMPTG